MQSYQSYEEKHLQALPVTTSPLQTTFPFLVEISKAEAQHIQVRPKHHIEHHEKRHMSVSHVEVLIMVEHSASVEIQYAINVNEVGIWLVLAKTEMVRPIPSNNN